MTEQEYGRLADKHSPKSPIVKNCRNAFLIGGTICTLGQLFITMYKYFGLDKTQASTAASISLVALSALLTGFGVFDKIAKFAGAGTLVPITGFANSIVSPAIEYKTEGQILGLGAKMFTIAGPVLVYGISASALYGVILYLYNMFF